VVISYILLIGEGIEEKHCHSTVKHLDLLCRFGHLDSTGFHVDGKYNSHEEAEEFIILFDLFIVFSIEPIFWIVTIFWESLDNGAWNVLYAR
jgi:hypothetical protein